MAPNQSSATENPNETILDQIAEQAANLEREANHRTIRQQLKDVIRQQARQENDTRNKTITFLLDKGATGEEITDKVQAFVAMSQSGPVVIRNSKEYLFVQMARSRDKEALIDYIRISPETDKLKISLKPPNRAGQYYERLPIKLEINNVPEEIKLDKIKTLIESLLSDTDGAKLVLIKDGKLNPKTKRRDISLKVNGAAFKEICSTMHAILPYNDGKTRSNLFIKVNCRPYQCNSCYTIGYHPKCVGKHCARCGSSDHEAKKCNRRTRFCRNCNKTGHRAKDPHCPRYMAEIAKEIRKFDFPIEYLEDGDNALQLAKLIQLK